jgi:hypothetical protein
VNGRYGGVVLDPQREGGRREGGGKKKERVSTRKTNIHVIKRSSD